MRNMILVVALSLLLSPRATLAQVANAELVGTVRDASQAILVGVAVRLTNVETGGTQAAQTNDSGLYSFYNIVPGKYMLVAEQSNFKRRRLEGIVLQVAQRARIDVTLEVGEISASVEVSAAAPLIDSETATKRRPACSTES